MRKSLFYTNEQGEISNIRKSLQSILDGNKGLFDKSNWKTVGKTNNKLKANLEIKPESYILDILDKCISNRTENIDTEQIEDYFPECNIIDYVDTYKKLLKGIKGFLLNNEISEEHKKDLSIILDFSERNKEIKMNYLIIILEIIGKYIAPSNVVLNIKDQNIINVTNKRNYDINDIFLLNLIKLG